MARPPPDEATKLTVAPVIPMPQGRKSVVAATSIPALRWRRHPHPEHAAFEAPSTVSVREAVAAILAYGLQTLGMETVRAYTDPGNLASQKVLLHCGFTRAGEIDLAEPTRHGARRAPLFRLLRKPEPRA